MAKIKFGAIGVEMRNKMGGSVFSKNRGGNYVRNKVSPVQPRTSYQQNQKANLANNSSQWRGLTAAQMATWNTGTAAFPYTDVFGDVKTLSGQQLYVQLNNRLVAAGQARITSCPSPVSVPQAKLTAAAAAAGAATFTVTVSDATVPTGCSLMIWATPELGLGITFVKPKMRQIGTTTLTAGVANIKTIWTNRFGSLVAGKNIWVRAVYINNTTGQIGVPTQISCTVAA